jgi:hypothetical protein
VREGLARGPQALARYREKRQQRTAEAKN